MIYQAAHQGPAFEIVDGDLGVSVLMAILLVILVLVVLCVCICVRWLLDRSRW